MQACIPHPIPESPPISPPIRSREETSSSRNNTIAVALQCPRVGRPTPPRSLSPRADPITATDEIGSQHPRKRVAGARVKRRCLGVSSSDQPPLFPHGTVREENSTTILAEAPTNNPIQTGTPPTAGGATATAVAASTMTKPALARVEHLKLERSALTAKCHTIQQAANRRRSVLLAELALRHHTMEAELHVYEVAMNKVKAGASWIDRTVTALIDTPIAGSVDPTEWLPNEMLMAVLLVAETGCLCRAVPLVCKRWYNLSNTPQMRARLKWARWEMYALAQAAPLYIPISAPEGTTAGHVEQATTLAVGPGGDVWTAGDDGTKMWTKENAPAQSKGGLEKTSDARSTSTEFHPTDVLVGHGGGVLALAVGPNGAVISGSTDRTAKIWSNTSSPVGCRGTLKGHGGAVRAVVVCGINTTIYTASDDCSIVAWRRSADNFVPQRLTGHTDRINALALGADGTLYSASDDSTVRVWSGSDGHLLRTLTGHSEPVWDVMAASNGLVYTAADDTLIHVWDAITGKHLRVLEGHTGGVHRVVETRDGAVVSSSDDWPNDPTIRVWNPDTGLAMCTIPITVPAATVPGGSAPANVVALASGQDGKLYALSAKAGSQQHVLIF